MVLEIIIVMMVVMMVGNKKLAKIILLTLGFSALSGCSTYNSSFGCGDAKGASCMPIDKVDRLIASGEIEVFTNPGQGGKCRGRNCSKKGIVTTEEELPEINTESKF